MITVSLPRPLSEQRPGQIVSTWVLSTGAPLATQVHLPYGDFCRGAIVVLPAVGRAEVVTHRSVRALADELARAGYVVLRAHLSGLGESGDLGSGSATGGAITERWLEDVASLHRFARAQLGQSSVSLVGVGLGATIAAVAAGEAAGRRDTLAGPSYDRLVLIDPVGAGRRWLRGQQALHATTCRPLPSTREGTALPGLLLNPDDAAAIGRLSLPDTAPVGPERPRVLVVPREDRPVEKVVARYVEALGADTQAAPDLPAALDGIGGSVVPRCTWAGVLSWLTATTPAKSGAAARFEPRVQATVTVDGVVEEFVDVAGRSGVLTRALGPTRQSLVMVPPDSEHRGGPSGHGWVTLARRAARLGVATLRLDRSGAGEAGDPRDDRDGLSYAMAAVADYEAAAGWLRERYGIDPVIAGHCSGGWVALMAAHHAPVSRVVSLVQEDWSTSPAHIYGTVVDDRALGGAALNRTAVAALGNEQRPLEGSSDATSSAWRQRSRRWLLAALPYPLLLALGKARELQLPQPILEGATQRGVPCDLYINDADGRRFLAIRGADALRSLNRRGTAVTMYYEAGADHNLLDPEALERALGYVLERALLDVRGLAPQRFTGQSGVSKRLVTEPSSKTS